MNYNILYVHIPYKALLYVFWGFMNFLGQERMNAKSESKVFHTKPRYTSFRGFITNLLGQGSSNDAKSERKVNIKR